MKRGTIRSRTTSGAFSARYFPADSAASSASGRRALDAASHALAPAEAKSDDGLDEPPLRPLVSSPSSSDLLAGPPGDTPSRAAGAAARGPAAAAAAFNAVP